MEKDDGKRKRLVDELSIEELEDELRKRKKKIAESDCATRFWFNLSETPVYHWPDASSLRLHVAGPRLMKIFRIISREFSERNDALLVPSPVPSEHILQAMFILRTHPSLIAEAFDKRTSLSYFLEAGADAKIMEELALMYKDYVPEKLKKSSWIYQFEREPNIVDDMCRYCRFNGESSVKVVVEQFSHQIMRPYFISGGIIRDRSVLPYETLILWFCRQKEESKCLTHLQMKMVEILEAMLAFHPEMMDELNRDIFLFCCASGREGKIWKRYYSEKMAQHSKISDLEVDSRYGFDSQASFAVGKVLPQLKRFRMLSSDGTTTKSCKNLLTVLLCERETTRLENLGLPICEPNECEPLFSAVLKRYPNLRTLELCMGPTYDEDQDHDDHDVGMEFCKKIMQDNPKIVNLVLDNFQLTTFSSLSGIITGIPSLSQLTLSKMKTASDVSWELSSFALNHSLKHVNLTDIDVNCGWVQGLLMQLTKAPLLTDVSLEQSYGDDKGEVTNILLSFLKANRIETFTFQNCTFDFHMAAEAMGKNTSLDELRLPDGFDQFGLLGELLEHHNTTLSTIHTEQYMIKEEEGRKVLHYKYLNYFGRKELSDQKKATLSTVVKKLCYIAKDTLDEECYAEGDEINLLKHGIQFGLLLLAPSVWAIVA